MEDHGVGGGWTINPEERAGWKTQRQKTEENKRQGYRESRVKEHKTTERGGMEDHKANRMALVEDNKATGRAGWKTHKAA